MTRQEFAEKIKLKMPEFQKMDNEELADLMLQRYPVYRSQITTTSSPTHTSVTPQTPVKSGNFLSDIGQDVSQTVSNVASRFKNIWSGQKEIQQREKTGETNIASGFLQQMGNVSGNVSNAFGDIITGIAKAGLSPDQEEKVKGFVANIGEKAMSLPPVEAGVEAYQKLQRENPELARNLESVFNIGMLATDVFGSKLGTSAMSRATGLAKTTALKSANTAGRVAGQAIETGIDFAQKAKPAAEKVGLFGISQTTGLSPKTIKNIIDNPEFFTKQEMAKLSRESLGDTVYQGITKRLDDLSETGKEYSALRQSDAIVSIPENTFKDVLEKKYNIIFDENGKVIRTAETTPLKPGDISDLEDFIDIYGNTTEMSANAFLNARKALSNLAQYDASKSDVANIIARDLRSQLDSFGKQQIDGLAALDAKYGPERELLSKIKRDYLNPDGTFKDNALTKIANLTKEGRQTILDRLEKIVPNIGEQINILSSIEDIRNAMGQKVGTYTRAVVGPLGGFSFAGIPGAIAGIIMTNPYTALSILRQYGKIRKELKGVIEKIIGKMKRGTRLDQNEVIVVTEAINNVANKIENTSKNLPLKK